MFLKLYCPEGLSGHERAILRRLGIEPSGVTAEWCYYVGIQSPPDATAMNKLRHPIAASCDTTVLGGAAAVLEIGPRPTFETPLSSTMRKVYTAIGVPVGRVERSRRYLLPRLSSEQRVQAASALHDPMTQMVYKQPLDTFVWDEEPAPEQLVPVLANGIQVLHQANEQIAGGLGMSDATIRFAHDLAVHQLGRDLTQTEVMTIAQANSEHCRHQTMRGEIVVDGVPLGFNFFKVLMQPYRANPNNSVIAFHDNASAIRGYAISWLRVSPITGEYELVEVTLHPACTAETHNWPTMVAPYPGAATGPGGGQRDGMALGRGSLIGAGGMGICVAGLLVPGYSMPWEDGGGLPPAGLPSALEVLIRGSDGASDYANCFGEPCITGHAATFDLVLPDGKRHAWRKPVLYTSRIGEVQDGHETKTPPESGMLVVQIGGPAYPIGLGGGSSSSKVGDATVNASDLAGVQRPDPATQRGLYNVIRKCVELGPDNPLESVHDLGAGGDANALPEIVGEGGGRFDVRKLPLGDDSMTVLEIFANEAQERCVVLVRPTNLALLLAIAEREETLAAVVGHVAGDGKVVLTDSAAPPGAPRHVREPLSLPASAFDGSGVIEQVKLTSQPRQLKPLSLPEGLTVRKALERVLRLETVGSKHFLVDKVDRSVGGRVVQQQCVGPFHTPLCGYGLLAHGMDGLTGTVTCHAERHRFGFISSAAQARMTVVEMLQKLMGVVISGLPDIRFSGNWMWPPLRENGHGVHMLQAAQAWAEMCVLLGIAEDGGKDSILMRSFDNQGNRVTSPEQLVLAPYATVPDIRLKVTPEVKEEGNSLILIDLSSGHARLGGSALAQVYGQVGDNCPDMTNTDLLKAAFKAVQGMVARGEIVSLHGRSDGGLVTTLIEMSTAGGLGIDTGLASEHDALASLFSEEAGVVIECPNLGLATLALQRADVPYQYLGKVTGPQDGIRIRHNDKLVVDEPQHTLRWLWAETSSRIDEQQSAPGPILAERKILQQPPQWPNWNLAYEPHPTIHGGKRPKAAVLRGLATNGEYEMAYAAMLGGFSVTDMTISDLTSGRTSLEEFQALLLPGGFSFGDIPQAAAAMSTILAYNDRAAEELAMFRARNDTLAFGACNGAQLMLRLGWAPFPELAEEVQPRFVRNTVERHKSTLVTVEILPSRSVMFRDMEESRLGVWISHGEGRLHTPDTALLDRLATQQLVPMRYVTPEGKPVEAADYPYNPSGTPHGWPAVCSADGRFTAVMPHPERMFRLWHLPWLPKGWENLAASPWLKPFQNARDWCLERQ